MGVGDDPWGRPDGVDDATVAAVGAVSEALERIERARGRLYDFHQLIGGADSKLEAAADALAAAGHQALADRIRHEGVGRNVLHGRWTFQVLDEFDDVYYRAIRNLEQAARDLVQGRRHVYEAEMKERRRTHGEPHHEARPWE